jgi:hypothetical protein
VNIRSLFVSALPSGTVRLKIDWSVSGTEIKIWVSTKMSNHTRTVAVNVQSCGAIKSWKLLSAINRPFIFPFQEVHLSVYCAVWRWCFWRWLWECPSVIAEVYNTKNRSVLWFVSGDLELHQILTRNSKFLANFKCWVQFSLRVWSLIAVEKLRCCFGLWSIFTWFMSSVLERFNQVLIESDILWNWCFDSNR